MKNFIIPALAILFITACSSSKQTKYNFSNVQSTSLDAQIYNDGPVMTDTVIILPQSRQ